MRLLSTMLKVRLLKRRLLNKRGVGYEIVEVNLLTWSSVELISVEYKIVRYEER